MMLTPVKENKLIVDEKFSYLCASVDMTERDNLIVVNNMSCTDRQWSLLQGESLTKSGLC